MRLQDLLFVNHVQGERQVGLIGDNLSANRIAVAIECLVRGDANDGFVAEVKPLSLLTGCSPVISRVKHQRCIGVFVRILRQGQSTDLGEAISIRLDGAQWKFWARFVFFPNFTNCDFARGGRAIGISSRNVELERKIARLTIVSPNEIKMNRVFAQAQIKTALLSTIGGRIREVSGVRQIGIARIVFILQLRVLFTKLHLRDKAPLSVDVAFVLVAFFRLPFLLAIVPMPFGFAHHPHVTALDRLAKQVIGVHRNRSILFGKVICAIRLYVYGEVGQIVPADFHRGRAVRILVLVVFQLDFDSIITQTRVNGHRPIDARNAKPRSLNLSAESRRVLRIGDL